MDSPCVSTVLVTPPSPSSRRSTGAGRCGRAGPSPTPRPEPTTTAARRSPLCRCVSVNGIWFTSYSHWVTVRVGGSFRRLSWFTGEVWVSLFLCFIFCEFSFLLIPPLCRSCCRSVRATETVSSLSITCCLGRTLVPGLLNTSTWTTGVNPVSSAAPFPRVPPCSSLSLPVPPCSHMFLPVPPCSQHLSCHVPSLLISFCLSSSHTFPGGPLTPQFPAVTTSSSSLFFPSLSWTQKTCGLWGRHHGPDLSAPPAADHLCSCLRQKSGPQWHLPLTPDETTPLWWVHGMSRVLMCFPAFACIKVNTPPPPF